MGQQDKLKLRANPSIFKERATRTQKAYSLELEDPPLLPPGLGTPRTKARQVSSSRLQQLGVDVTPSKLRAAHSPNGKNIRVAIQRWPDPLATQAETSKLRQEVKSLTSDVRRLIASSKEDRRLWDKKEENLSKKVERVYTLVRRSLLHWYQAELVRKTDFSQSLTAQEWQTLSAMTDDQICTPAGLSVQEAGMVRPGTQLREFQNRAAHSFCLEDGIEATNAMRDDDTEKSLYRKIIELRAGGRIF